MLSLHLLKSLHLFSWILHEFLNPRGLPKERHVKRKWPIMRLAPIECNDAHLFLAPIDFVTPIDHFDADCRINFQFYFG